MIKERKLDIITGILLLILMLVFFIAVQDIRAPAHLFPITVIILITLFTIILLVRSIFFYKPAVFDNNSKEEDTRTAEEKRIGKKRVYFSILFMTIYIFSVRYIGFYVSSLIYLGLFSWYLGGLKKELKVGLISIVVSLTTMTIIYFAFEIFLRVPTPEGLFF